MAIGKPPPTGERALESPRFICYTGGMSSRIYAAFLLLFAVAAPAQEDSTASTNPQAYVVSLMKKASSEMAALVRCRKLQDSVERDYNAKKNQLTSQYGRIPPSLVELMDVKMKRVGRMHKLCADTAAESGRILNEAETYLRGVEPKSLEWLEPRHQELRALQNRHNALTRKKD